MQPRWRIIALTAALLVAGLTSAHAQDLIKVGGIGPLSGGGTAWGLAAQRGMELAIEEIQHRLHSASRADEAEPLSLDAAMAFLRHSPSA